MHFVEHGRSRLLWLSCLAFAFFPRSSLAQNVPAPAPRAGASEGALGPLPAPSGNALPSADPPFAGPSPAPGRPEAAPQAAVAARAQGSATIDNGTPAGQAAPVGPEANETPRESVNPEAEPGREPSTSNGVFGPFRIGFLIGGGLPDLISLGGVIKLTRYFGAGINVGLIPTVKISYYGDAALAFQEYDAYGRIYPFGGALFLGAGVGYATIKGTLGNHFDLASYQQMYPGLGIPASVDVNSQASVRTLVLTPQIGLLHTFDSGFSIGADIGAQVPIAPSQVQFQTAIPESVPAPLRDQVQQTYITPNDQKVRSTLDKIGRTTVPTFNIKIGFLL